MLLLTTQTKKNLSSVYCNCAHKCEWHNQPPTHHHQPIQWHWLQSLCNSNCHCKSVLSLGTCLSVPLPQRLYSRIKLHLIGSASFGELANLLLLNVFFSTILWKLSHYLQPQRITAMFFFSIRFVGYGSVTGTFWISFVLGLPKIGSPLLSGAPKFAWRWLTKKLRELEKKVEWTASAPGFEPSQTNCYL